MHASRLHVMDECKCAQQVHHKPHNTTTQPKSQFQSPNLNLRPLILNPISNPKPAARIASAIERSTSCSSNVDCINSRCCRTLNLNPKPNNPTTKTLTQNPQIPTDHRQCLACACAFHQELGSQAGLKHQIVDHKPKPQNLNP